jgi:ABC-2 type transport system ATP-binding protein
VIEVSNLTRRYGATLALSDVSFKVAKGEIVGFLGPNGAGKSTAMKILTGSLAATSGKVKIAGMDITDEPIAVRRLVGYMPESVPLYQDQTVLSFLEFVARIKGVGGSLLRNHLAEIIEQTGLGAVQGKLVGNLSHGYRQRTGLAQALVGNPEVLILDEPTNGLDPHQIVEIRDLVKNFQGGRTVLLSSHILSEVSAVCQRVIILDEGNLVADRTVDSGLTEDVPHCVALSWDGDRQKVAEALALVSGVDEINITDTGAEVIIGGNPVEIRPKLVESILASGGLLQNIQDKGPSLEDIFLKLTGATDELEGPPVNTSEEEDSP